MQSLDEIIKSRASIRRSKRGSRCAQAVRDVPRNAGVPGRDDVPRALRAAVPQTMDAHQLDAMVYPTWSNPPRLIGDLNTPAGDNSQLFSPSTGWPAITVPMGYTRGDAAGRAPSSAAPGAKRR